MIGDSNGFRSFGVSLAVKCVEGSCMELDMDFVRFVNYDYQYIHTYVCMYIIYKVIYLNVCYHYCLLFVGEISFTFDPYSVFEKRRRKKSKLKNIQNF